MLKTIAIPERARNVGIAVAVAAFAAMLTAFYVSNYKRNVQQDQKNVPVLVATKRIEAGTTGREAISKHQATVQELPRLSVVSGSFASLEQIRPLVAVDDIYPGEQVTARRFSPLEERGVRAKLDGNLRAIEVPGERQQLLAGTLREGDRVDVLANFKLDSASGSTNFSFTRLVLRDILVVRGTASTGGSAVSSDSDTVSLQLALTDTQSQKLFFSMENASKWWLTLRPVNNAADSPESVETLWTTLRDGLRWPQIQKAFYGSAIAK